jgi:phosphoglycerate dehydrogenase-like enzyme
MRIAILDDYQNVAMTYGNWAPIKGKHEVTVFNDHLDGNDALAKRLAPFDIIVIMRERTPFPKELFAKLQNLKLLVTSGMRNLGIDMKAATERKVLVCGTENVGFTTAELTWGLILALARNIPAEDRGLREGAWQKSVGLAMYGKTLGVIGLGKVGGHVAKIGKAFGFNVLAWSQNLTTERCKEQGVTYATKDELLAKSDFVTIHLVLSSRSEGLIGAADLAKMKKSAFLINTSRGPIVKQDDLIAALKSGTIAGAGIDVYDVEPLPANHPLKSAPHTILTPHLGYVTDDNYKLWHGQCAEDVAAWLDGKPLRILNPEVQG